MQIRALLLELNSLIGSLLSGSGGWDYSPAQVPLNPHSPGLSSKDHRVFVPPGAPDDNFTCDYRAMSGFKLCDKSFRESGCWLRNNDTGKEYSIDTDYENDWPIGVTRKYYLELNNATVNADGVNNTEAKFFNSTYPGPWLQACWGDDVEITVKNNLPYNGTTVHMHGVRMFNSPEMDGVNGITQCPIPPGGNFTYKFKVTQYGTTWYHSHYSLQYGDGALGPITLHGPSTHHYDEPINPIMMTDFNHRSAFEDYYIEQGGHPPKMTSILLNGKGSYAGAGGNDKYNITLPPARKSGKKPGRELRTKSYLLRLINTSVDTTFVFAIDGHNLTVIGADLVPIVPYETEKVVIGIGQRYHAILHSNANYKEGESFWIRTIPADDCSNFELGGIPDERQGVLVYSHDAQKPYALPTTPRSASISTDCSDEPYDLLVPHQKWKVMPHEGGLDNDTFFAGTGNWSSPIGDISGWSLGDQPMWLNFTQPTVLSLDNTEWPNGTIVVEREPDEDSWLYIVVTGTGLDPKKHNVSAAHPIHLHGHDFALLQQSSEEFSLDRLNLKFDNPPRRDVVLLPQKGFVVIAFKADNPGAWILHCHIAWHASAGLALQIIENKSKVKELMGQDGRQEKMTDLCNAWNEWQSNSSNWWHEDGPFQDDSGI